MVTLDANTKINLGQLVALLALGLGGIWKVADITASIAVGNTKLTAIEQKVGDLSDTFREAIRRSEYDAMLKSQSARDAAQDVRMDRFDRLLDGDSGMKGK